MAEVKDFPRVQLLCGMLYADSSLRDKAVTSLIEMFGEVSLSFDPIPFDFTNYYVPEIGEGIKREILGFERMIDPSQLATIKQVTNDLEAEIADLSDLPRPVNLDPGYLDRYKLVLASTKDGPMRIALRDGIFAEVTLHFIKGSFQYHRLTYADYRDDRILAFLCQLRKLYLDNLKH